MVASLLVARLTLAALSSAGLLALFRPDPSSCELWVKDDPDLGLNYKCVPEELGPCTNCDVSGVCTPKGYTIGNLLISECWCTAPNGASSQDACATMVEWNSVTGTKDIICLKKCCPADAPTCPPAAGAYPVYTDPCKCR